MQKNQQVEPWDVLMFLPHAIADSMVRHDKNIPDITKSTIAQVKMAGLILEHHGAGIMLKDLARDLGITPSAASQTVDALVREGIIERCVNENDRRSVLFCPSKKGLIHKKQRQKLLSELMDKLLVSVSPEERKTTLHVLNVIYEGLLKEKAKVRC